MENKNICIDLNKVIKGDVIYYPINELIHREQIMRVGNILLGRMKEAEEYTPGRNENLNIKQTLFLSSLAEEQEKQHLYNPLLS